MEAGRDTPYQPLDSSTSGVNPNGSDNDGTDRHKKPESSSPLDGSPTPLMGGESGSSRTHFDVSSESGGGSDSEGGLKTGKTGRGPKKTISFWVSIPNVCEQRSKPSNYPLPFASETHTTAVYPHFYVFGSGALSRWPYHL